MNARTVFLQFDRSRLQDGLKVYKEQVAPAAKEQAGFVSLLLLLDKEMGTATSVSVWENAEALAATDATSYYVEQITKLGQFFETAAEREDYEVGVFAEGTEACVPTYARLVRATFHSNRTDAGVKVYDETLIANARKQQGFAGAWLLVERVRGKAFSISLWDSEDAITGGEISPYYIGQILKLVPYVASLPESEQCEVAYFDRKQNAPG